MATLVVASLAVAAFVEVAFAEVVLVAVGLVAVGLVVFAEVVEVVNDHWVIVMVFVTLVGSVFHLVCLQID